MGKVLSLVQRRLNRINVENRAHKVISKDKPTPAPMYPSTKKILDKIIKEHPEVLETSKRKDPNLHDRLKQVYVTSQDPDFLEVPSKTSQNLPQSRHTPAEPEFGFHEPAIIPHGRVTLRQAIKFITDHQSDPETWTVDLISKDYNISKNITEKVLEHFHAFQIYIPKKESYDKRTELGQFVTKKLSSSKDKSA